MGLIKAGVGAIGGVLADQWKEYFYCEGMTPDDIERMFQLNYTNLSVSK